MYEQLLVFVTAAQRPTRFNSRQNNVPDTFLQRKYLRRQELSGGLIAQLDPTVGAKEL